MLGWYFIEGCLTAGLCCFCIIAGVVSSRAPFAVVDEGLLFSFDDGGCWLFGLYCSLMGVWLLGYFDLALLSAQ